MPDFAFYRDSFLGSRIPEAQFGELAAAAAGQLECWERWFRVVGGEQARAMAICAMAECLLTQRSRKGAVAASVGSLSVRYPDSVAWEGELYKAAGVYLDFYRGV